jgi:hypothetical protein
MKHFFNYSRSLNTLVGTRIQSVFAYTVFILFISGVMSSSPANAQMSNYKAQALCIYNFTKYINWQSGSSKLTIGVLGKSGILPELNEINGRVVSGKAIEIKQINSLDDAMSCQIVYLPSSQSKNLSDLMSLVQGKGVLLISENDLASKGAAISFLIIEDKLKFKVNTATVKEAGLQISNSLLSIAILI